MTHAVPPAKHVTTPWWSTVTPREADVLAGVRGHATNAQIADDLYISVRTVETHVSALLRKAGAADRRELARLAELLAAAPERVGLRTFDSTFVGRDDLTGRIEAALTRRRVVSLIGPGGIGKTRLAHETLVRADDTWDPLVAVDLLPVRPGRVAATVAAVFAAPLQADVPAAATVVRAIGARHVLLLLDNAEHLLGEVADLVGRVHRGCPHTTVVTTSREPLRVPEEWVIRVPALDVDPGGDAIRLFRDRSGMPPSPDLDGVVAALEGIPLSIELAAARVGALGLTGVRAGLGARLPALSGGRDPDPRHRSAAATVSWSLALLPLDERRLLRQVATLTHAFDLATASAIGNLGLDAARATLTRLTERSLLQPAGEPDTPRWRMLEMVRQVALGSAPPAGHAERVAAWATTRCHELLAQAVTVMSPDLPDLIDTTLQPPVGGPDPALYLLADAMGALCARIGSLNDAIACLVQAAGAAPDASSAVTNLLDAASISAALYGDDGTHRLLRQARERAHDAGDASIRSHAVAQSIIGWYRYPNNPAAPAPPGENIDHLLAAATTAAGTDHSAMAACAAAAAWHHGTIDAATHAVNAAEATHDPVRVAAALDAYVTACANAHRLRDAYRAAHRRISLLRAWPATTPRAIEEATDLLHAAATTALVTGQVQEALTVDDLRPDLTHHGANLPREVRALTMLGRFPEALQTAEVMWARWLGDGSPPRTWMSTAAALAALAAGLNGADEHQWRERALRLAGVDRPDQSPTLAAVSAYVDARLAVHRRDHDDAERIVRACHASFPDRWYQGFARCAGTELAVAAELNNRSRLLQQVRPYADQSDWVDATLLRCQARLNRDPGPANASLALWTRIGATFEADTTRSVIQG
ncbi:MAG: LuxR C-terminal-related transcriptional regulator [Tetrasphaera sp.]